jgi:hypothetical protein
MSVNDHVLTKSFLATGGSVAYSMGQTVKFAAGSTLQPAQCALATANSDLILGVVMEDLDAAKVNTGKAYVSVAMIGIALCIAGANNIAAGDRLTVDSSSRVVTSTTATHRSVGMAMGPSAAIGDYISVFLMPGQFCA